MKPEVVAVGIRVSEGPTWRPEFEDLICVSIMDGFLVRIDPQDGSVEVFADTAGGPNGTAPCADGGLLVANNGGIDFAQPEPFDQLTRWSPGFVPGDVRPVAPCVQRVYPDGSVETFLGQDFEVGSPNDIVVAPDNSVIFTDLGVPGLFRYRPPGVAAWPTPLPTVDPDGRVEFLANDHPNGIAVAPDGRVLVVAGGGVRWLDPEVGVGELFNAELNDARKARDVPAFLAHPVADGITFDAEGRLYACLPWDGDRGLWVIDSDGTKLAELDPPEDGMTVSNLVFGGPDRSILFATDFKRSRVLAWEGLPSPGFEPPAFVD